MSGWRGTQQLSLRRAELGSLSHGVVTEANLKEQRSAHGVGMGRLL